MIIINDIVNAWITDIKTNIANIKTVDRYEGNMNIEMFTALAPKMPAILVHYEEGVAIEEERNANGASGKQKNIIGCVIAATSYSSRLGRTIDAHSFLDAIQQQYDGYTLPVGTSQIVLGFLRRSFIFQQSGQVVYYISFQYFT